MREAAGRRRQARRGRRRMSDVTAEGGHGAVPTARRRTGSGTPRELAAVRGVRARQARPQPRARRLAARRRRRDGPAQRPRPLHPPQRGRQHLGGARRPTSPPPARTRRTRSSRPAATRSTATRRSTRSPTTSRTCERSTRAVTADDETVLRARSTDEPRRATPRVGVRHRLRRPAGRRRHRRARRRRRRRPGAVLPDARRRRAGLLAAAAPSGSPTRPSWRRRSRSANIALDLLGQARLLLAPGRRQRSRATGRRRGRARLPAATPTSSATSALAERPTTATSPQPIARLLVVLDRGGWRCSTGCVDVPRPGAGRDRGARASRS